MPTKKYRVDTDKGSYEVEVEEPWTAPEGGVLGQAQRSIAESKNEQRGEDPNSPVNRVVRNPMVQSSAHPQSVGDFLGLLLPVEEARALVPSMFKGLKAFREGGFKGVRSWAFGKPQFTQADTGRLWNELPEAVKMEFTPGGDKARMAPRTPFTKGRKAEIPPNPETKVGGPPYEPIRREGLNDLPTYKQQEILERTGAQGSIPSGSNRVGTPPYQPPKLKVPNVKPPTKKADTLDDVLNEALTEAQGPSLEVGRSTLPSEMRTVGEGVTKQSGTFSKSGSAGQPGGYTSGRPGINEQQYDDLLSRMGGKGPAQPDSLEEMLGNDMAAESVPGREPLGTSSVQATSGNPAAPSAPASETSIPGPSAASEPKLLESPLTGGEGEWHSGAAPGSADAAAARATHRGMGESTVPIELRNPAIDELLAQILGKVQ